MESANLSRIVSSVAFRHSLSPNDLPDLLQEVVFALLRVGEDGEINASWIFHTATHKAIDLLRQNRLIDVEMGDDAWVAHGSEDPELLHLLRARVARLPARLLEFYTLRYEQGFSLRETARRMGIRFSSARLMHERCLRFLEKYIEH